MVNGAAGAVGHIVCQIAKIKGCKVIAFTGSDSKVSWLKDDLGLDFAFNYKKVNENHFALDTDFTSFLQVKVENALNKALENGKGIDCFFDNVGGRDATVIISRMNQFGRIGICGNISSYNSEPVLVPEVTAIIVAKVKIRIFY